jgi:hypothetical protein
LVLEVGGRWPCQENMQEKKPEIRMASMEKCILELFTAVEF